MRSQDHKSWDRYMDCTILHISQIQMYVHINSYMWILKLKGSLYGLYCILPHSFNLYTLYALKQSFLNCVVIDYQILVSDYHFQFYYHCSVVTNYQ